MRRQPISQQQLTAHLVDLGVRPGGVLLVHTSFSNAGPVDGGPDALIAALRSVLGPEGTLVMPSMSDDDDVPFDAERTPCRGMGVVADMFWRLPGVRRSDSPHAFAAIGPDAARITADRPLAVPHGLDSPVGRVYEADGQVLLLGVGHDANTTIHLAETMAPVRYRRSKHLTVLRDGRPVRHPYEEIDHCCQNFSRLDEWLDAAHLQRRGVVGHGEARLIRSRDIVGVALEQLRENDTVFLHPVGVDAECDEARASMAMHTETRLFLEFSRKTLLDEYWPRMRGCVESLTDAQVWWRPNESSNSIGNLLLHLNGNVRQWLIGSFNRTGDARNRPAEFAEREPIAPAALLERLGATLDEAGTVLSRLTAEDLLATLQIQGYTTTGLEAVYHVVEHFGMHYGQILYITKLVRGEDLGFYRHLDKTGRLSSTPGA